MFKKKIILIALMLVMTLSIGGAFAQDFPEISADVISKSVADVNNLKIMVGDTNGNFRGEDTITRAEFSVIICRIMGYEDMAKTYSGSSYFTDTGNHWAKGYIETARLNNYINGFSDGSFRPQDNVTVGQAVKMLVCALGYEDDSVKRRGFPLGYTAAGGKIGLAGGADLHPYYLDTVPNDIATRNFIAFLVSNALDVPLCEGTGYGMNEFGVLERYTETYDGTNGKELRTLRIKNYGGR